MIHSEMKVWQISIDLVEDIFKLTKKFPKEETYTLAQQMKRAAISIPSNIAEGMARNSTKECIRFLHISLGSLSELDTQLIIANRLGFTNGENMGRINRVKMLLLGTIRHLRTKL